MTESAAPRCDVAIVGAGPVGSICALAYARKGARVVLLEANPKASWRLAGEWLHPPAVQMLKEVGINSDRLSGAMPGRGFVVFPEDGKGPIMLPYHGRSRGLVCEHSDLVALLHEAVKREGDIDFITHARVSSVEDGRLTYTHDGSSRELRAGQIVGADGRASVVRRSLRFSTDSQSCSMMLGTILHGVELAHENYGHILLGGPGPILMYRVAGQRVRIIVDVPVDHYSSQDRVRFLSESFAVRLPEPLRQAFVEALFQGRYKIMVNRLMPRVAYGNERCTLVGDAAGHYHPLTAVGMTLGFGDALALAEGSRFRDFTARRYRAIRVPELLAMGLYEVFGDDRAEATALRRAIYRGWRSNVAYRDRTIRLLACEDRSVVSLALAFTQTMMRVVGGFFPRSDNRLHHHRRARHVIRALLVRVWWLIRWGWYRANARRSGGRRDTRIRDSLSHAFPFSMGNYVGKCRKTD